MTTETDSSRTEIPAFVDTNIVVAKLPHFGEATPERDTDDELDVEQEDDQDYVQVTVSPVNDIVGQFTQSIEAGTPLSPAVGALDIPMHFFTDQYIERDDNRKDFEGMIRALIYQHITGRTDQGMQRLTEEYNGYAWIFDLDGFVSRNTFRHTRENRLDTTGWNLLEQAAEKMLRVAYECDRVDDDLLAEHPDAEDDEGDSKLLQAVRKARQVTFASWKTHRAENASHSDEDHLRQLAYMAMGECGTTQGASRFKRNGDGGMSANTHLRISKQYGLDDVIEAFNDSVADIHNKLNLYTEYERPVSVAIDITPIPYWGDPESLPQVAGAHQGDTVKSPYKLLFATITVIRENIPIILGFEPVVFDSPWNDNDTFRNAEAVKKLVDRASEHVNIHMVMADSEFAGGDTVQALDDRDINYLFQGAKHSSTIKTIRKMNYEWDKHVHIEDRGYHLGDGEYTDTKRIYIPTRNWPRDKEPENGHENKAVFITNADWVDESNAWGFAEKYSNRWTIENQYKVLKSEFLPPYHGHHFPSRVFYFAFGCALQNAWRLADFYHQKWGDGEYGYSPELPAGEFVDLVTGELEKD